MNFHTLLKGATPVNKLQASDAITLLEDVQRRLEGRIARAWAEVVNSVRNRADATRIARLIEQNRINDIIAELVPSAGSDELQRYRNVIAQAVTDGARASAGLNGETDGPEGEFDPRLAVGAQMPRLAQFADTMTSTRIRQIDDQAAILIRQTISQAAQAGENPRKTGITLRDSIGLTAYQAQAVQNYRTALEDLNSDALDRALRDKRSDSLVRRHIRDGEPLSEKQVNSLVNRYYGRYLNYRATVIARTESLRAVNGAQFEFYNDLVDRGLLDERQVRKTWITSGDDRVRNAHQLIPSMNPDGVPLNQPFTSTLGPIMYPGDPDAVAANVIQCRCVAFYRVTSWEVLQRAA